MRELRLLVVYLAAVFMGGPLAAPWLWKAAQAAAASSSLFAALAHQPFHRYVNRCLLVFALAGLWPLHVAFGRHRRREHGWQGPWLRPLLVGSAIGSASLGCILLGSLTAGDATLAPNVTPLALLRRLASALGAAACVAVIEEWLFRGLIHAALRRSLPFAFAATVTSVLFGLVHFFDRPPQPEIVGPLSGLWTLGHMLHGFTDLTALVPGLLNLCFVGWMLALARERTGALALSIGIHAGWVLCIKLMGYLVVRHASEGTLLWGSAKVFDGWAASVVLASQLLVMHLVTRGASRPDAG